MAEEKALNDQMRARRQKMQALEDDLHIDPFGHRFDRDSLAADLHEKFDGKSEEELAAEPKKVVIAGRMVAKRGAGKVIFADIRDRSGQIQIYARRDDLGDNYPIIKRSDLGDFLGIEGQMMKTEAGELTILVSHLTHLSKALRPMPDKYHGISDVETKYRKRYLDLIANNDSLVRFQQRSQIISAVRAYMDQHQFMEVETPILQTQAGGAAAKPFITHHNALNIDMYMRIATELYLKRLIVGGMERVYEIGRIFRNEGMDAKHNPEFTTMESYAAYWDFKDVMDQAEGIFKAAAAVVSDDLQITYQGVQIDLNKPFARKHMVDLIKEKAGVDFWPDMSVEEAQKLADDKGVKYEKFWGVGHIINAFFDEFVEDTLEQPTIVYGHPVEVSPLAKKNAEDPRFTDRFEIFIMGSEYGNAFSELNDPIDQRARFEAQMAERENGNDEAEAIDEDFIEALEYGMPPTGGLGIGIDRLVMLLTDTTTIRDAILFPTMRP
ncbi:lysine--tRNA ligase [Fructobacillus sp. M1-13]|uniref:Lysine--tRNA ligase n=1 Tax=Fructobacillus papyriferae TaxID=2713171 RepID=A0ABS5QRQ1_9LACO|nr:lysine--tRNA ligase [Fructobacillus papyriferae]MBS9335602.1 lysine--tRNA ligase [Fructobacillus papyriferae]MCD2159309.1 lysine--tRNA ligase [Fructobacillus papyriferae]